MQAHGVGCCCDGAGGGGGGGCDHCRCHCCCCWGLGCVLQKPCSLQLCCLVCWALQQHSDLQHLRACMVLLCALAARLPCRIHVAALALPAQLPPHDALLLRRMSWHLWTQGLAVQELQLLSCWRHMCWPRCCPVLAAVLRSAWLQEPGACCVLTCQMVLLPLLIQSAVQHSQSLLQQALCQQHQGRTVLPPPRRSHAAACLMTAAGSL